MERLGSAILPSAPLFSLVFGLLCCHALTSLVAYLVTINNTPSQRGDSQEDWESDPDVDRDREPPYILWAECKQHGVFSSSRRTLCLPAHDGRAPGQPGPEPAQHRQVPGLEPALGNRLVHRQ